MALQRHNHFKGRERGDCEKRRSIIRIIDQSKFNTYASCYERAVAKQKTLPETKIYASVPYITGITDRFEERVRQEQ